MWRSIFGFAAFAVLAWLGIMFMFSIMGGMIRIAATLLWLAAMGFVCYLVLRVISPSTADKVRDIIRGRSAGA